MDENAIPDRELLRALAGSRVFARGEEYFRWGRVYSLVRDQEAVDARVDGNSTYAVSLRLGAQPMRVECDCPQGQAGKFCKHCVAVCLALREEPPDAAAGAVTMDDMRGYLTGLSKSELVELALAESIPRESRRPRLLLRAARAAGKRPDLAPYRRMLLSVVNAISMAEDEGDFSRADGEIRLLIDEGFAEDACCLLEEALTLIVVSRPRQAMNHPLAASLLALHLMSCRKLDLDLQRLIERLFRWQLACGWSSLSTFESAYGQLLGRVGLDAYRDRVAAEWAREHVAGSAEVRLSDWMTELAEERRDLDLLIDIRSRRLAGPDDYLALARTCARFGRLEMAIDWARRGIEPGAFPESEELHEFLAKGFEDRGAWREAAETRFAMLTARPSLEGYAKLMESARRVNEEEGWRARALYAIQSHRNPAAASVLVHVLLWEGDDDGAWAAARETECSGEILLTLAERRSARHPEDAIRIYERLVGNSAGRKNNYAYRQAIEFLRRIGRLRRKQGRMDEFIAYLKRLRQTYRAQRTFVKLVDQKLARYLDVGSERWSRGSG